MNKIREVYKQSIKSEDKISSISIKVHHNALLSAVIEEVEGIVKELAQDTSRGGDVWGQIEDFADKIITKLKEGKV